ncbi:MAG: hypothetical protein IPH80_29660 [Myxococcales bacterium]|nr:hypothetical protein [Myxococcales bacterium]
MSLASSVAPIHGFWASLAAAVTRPCSKALVIVARWPAPATHTPRLRGGLAVEVVVKPT